MISVAVKSPTADARHTFEAEMDVMVQLTKLGGHKHIVKLIGCVHGKRPLLVLELCQGGSLKEYLVTTRTARKAVQAASSFLPSAVTLATFGNEIALAMAFLEQHSLLHRDLAARNILLTTNDHSEQKTCKLADFGLTRVTDTEYYRRTSTSAPIAIRWMATETLDDNVSTIESDRYVCSGCMYACASNHKQVH